MARIAQVIVNTASQHMCPAERGLDSPITRGGRMAKCDMCGNDYDKAFTVTMGGVTRTFDSFECAIHSLAPTCAHCGCRIIGHGVEASGTFYCCAHCASESGVKGIDDRV